MWWVDLAVAVGFLIGVGVKELIDFHNERARRTPEAVKTAKRGRSREPRQ